MVAAIMVAEVEIVILQTYHTETIVAATMEVMEVIEAFIPVMAILI
jgi:hypothetical protein